MHDKSIKLFPVILAAGDSTRLGQPKQLASFRGSNLISFMARQFCELNAQKLCEQPMVVVADKDAFVKRSIDSDIINKVSWLSNLKSKEGMGTSIASAIKFLSNEQSEEIKQHSAILISLCDQWRLTSRSFLQLIDAWRLHPGRIHASFDRDWRGPPAIFPSAFWPELSRLRKHGAKHLLKQYKSVVSWHLLDGCHCDLDNESDLQAMRDFDRRLSCDQSHR